MANNKGREKLDQSTGDTLTGIDRLLAELSVNSIAKDEFTIAMVQERSPGLSAGALRCRLDRLVEAGVCSKRKIVVAKRETNAFRYL